MANKPASIPATISPVLIPVSVLNGDVVTVVVLPEGDELTIEDTDVLAIEAADTLAIEAAEALRVG